ncbi:MAG TPA: competence protein CoiA family protein [Rhabdochlamydiaceae bacterium]|nr:competence protein CoiA family protein [Rhabdochlamydiaceae bacterium]
MKYALVNGERQEAKPGLSGKCDCCGDPIVAKCGDERIWHWSHKGNRTCDLWWENQTEWHRAWKGQFPTERQEIIHTAPNGEKHIADVKTDQNYVIEFQHSHLNPQERIVREAFYQNMIWVVDGTRLKKDYPRFLEGKKNFRPVYKPGFFLVHFPEECFPTAWIDSSVEVVFDFQGSPLADPQEQDALWCLLPGRARRCGVVIAISRQTFITTLLKQPRLLPNPAHQFVTALDKLLAQQEEIKEQQTQKQEWKPRKRTFRL